MQFDWIVRNGEIIDGTGAPARKADIGIENDRITAIGDLSKADSKEVADASGLTVTPGFIDAHSHSDAYLLIEPTAPSKLSQGITTEINGQCGGSAAPRFGVARLSSDWASQYYPVLTETPGKLEMSPTPGATWSSVASYRSLFEAVHPSINTILFIGHNTLRASSMGYLPQPADPAQLAALCDLLRQAMDEGGWGLSTGLLYQPGKFSTPEEVQALAKVAAEKGGMYATHMRSESNRILEAIDEVLDLARKTGIQVQVSHLKTSGESNWGKIDTVLQKLNDARAEGIRLFSDRYPYVAAGTEIDVVFPDWAGAGGRDPELERLADPKLRARIVEEINASGRNWERVMIGGAWSDTVRPFSGKSLAEAARTLHLTPGETVCLFVEKDQTRTGGFFFGMSTENLHKIFEQPWIACGSDASLRTPTGPLGIDHPHPRAYGTFPEFFRLLTGQVEGFAKICGKEEAIRRMTGLPADIFGIRRRGLLKEGYYADLDLIDLSNFRAKATYQVPHQFSEGVKKVFVNGKPAYDNGTFLPQGHGRFLTR